MLPSSGQAKGERARVLHGPRAAAAASQEEDREGRVRKGLCLGDGRGRTAVGGLKYLSTSAEQSGPGFNLLGSFSITKSTRGYWARQPLPRRRAFHSPHGGLCGLMPFSCQ